MGVRSGNEHFRGFPTGSFRCFRLHRIGGGLIDVKNVDHGDDGPAVSVFKGHRTGVEWVVGRFRFAGGEGSPQGHRPDFRGHLDGGEAGFETGEKIGRKACEESEREERPNRFFIETHEDSVDFGTAQGKGFSRRERGGDLTSRGGSAVDCCPPAIARSLDAHRTPECR